VAANARDERLLAEQIAYYRARAAEYDEWFLRQGRYDRGEAHRRAWFAEVAEVEAALVAARPRGRVLELACGTGLWTRHLVAHADEVLAVDASPEVLAINRERVASAKVRYQQADLFAWRPETRFDFVLFAFWLSHVPPERFEGFWSLVGDALAPGGSVFFADNAENPEVAAANHRLPERGSYVMDRMLNDGRGFRVVKVFYDPAELEARLGRLGWSGAVRSTGRYFIHGCVGREASEG
jgi:SAM-dependent methyltransferase